MINAPSRPRGRARRRLRLPLLVLAALVAGLPARASGRESPRSDTVAVAPEWNDSATVALVRGAIEARRHAWADSALRAFDAYAEGRVLFLADFGGDAGQHLVRADQIALELHWRRGLGSLQTLVGRREAEWAPTRIHYHVDHLTLVVDNYQDSIRIGEGDEIREAPHPLASDALQLYDYRLVDSLAMRISGRWHRLYRVEIRPRHPDRPAVIGTMDIEAGSRALARLAVSFTPASYVDPRVVDVSVDLENALVEGRWWLPARQRTEIRRRMEWMELPFGSTIRSSFEVLDYDLDPKGRGGVRPGHHVAARPRQELEHYAGWRELDLAGPLGELRRDSVSLEEIRARATEIAKRRYLGGTAPLRLYVPSVSTALRARRAEGIYLGAGARWNASGVLSFTGTAGWAFARERPEGRIGLERTAGDWTLSAGAWAGEHADAGAFPAASGVVSSLGAVFRGDDYVDPFFRSGGAVGVTRRWLDGVGAARLVVQREDSASLVLDPLGGTVARPVRPIEEGTDLRLELSWSGVTGELLGSRLEGEAAALLSAGGDFGYTRWIVGGRARPRDPEAIWHWEGDAAIAVASGTLPAQRLLTIGGRGTVPGYPFRAFAGDVTGWASVALSRDAWAPWVRARLLAAVGWSRLTGPGEDAARRLGLSATGTVRPSLGCGVSLVHDLVRLDVAHGLDRGEWEWMLSVNPVFRSPL